MTLFISDVLGFGVYISCSKCGRELRDDHGQYVQGKPVCRAGHKCSLRVSRNRLAADAAAGIKPRWR